VTFAFREAFTGVSDYSGAATYGTVVPALLHAFPALHRRPPVP
jgi:arabinogalactan oligomer/maltooligosaccharide transport system permease protein